MGVISNPLSGSTDYMPIKIVATATLGTTIHTAVAGQSSGVADEIWLWGHNTSASLVTLTLEYGDATAPDHNVIVTLAAQSGWIPLLLGQRLRNGKVLTAFASSANVITVQGHVNSIT